MTIVVNEYMVIGFLIGYFCSDAIEFFFCLVGDGIRIFVEWIFAIKEKYVG